jgi:excinuclease ABC subunit C
MNRCAAPCAGAITRNQYAAQIKRARAFLDGRDDSPLDEIDRRIHHAVSERRYEQAAILRDLRIDLTDLRDRLLPRDDLLPSSFVYAVERRGRTCWLAVHEATVMKVATAPRDPRTFLIWQALLNSWRSTVMPLVEDREGGELQILAAWFRRHPDELERVMDFDTAGRVVTGSV